MQVKFKKLNKDAVIPKYSRDGDVGLDLVAVGVDDRSYLYTEFDTGLAVEIPDGYFGMIVPRSSITNKGHTLKNSVGIIDSNYRGSIKFRMTKNTIGDAYNVGERVGQLIILPYPKIEPIESDELSDTNRGTNGYGSSGS
jgi:dUTP pyrophosphatase